MTGPGKGDAGADLSLIASFGDHVPMSQFKPDDRISVLSFSPNGRFLASGDHAGRVVIFQFADNLSRRPAATFVSQIHAHKSEFDFFRSELSEPRLNAIRWVPENAVNPHLLTCNSHEAKLWKLVAGTNMEFELKGDDVPVLKRASSSYTGECIHTLTDIKTEFIMDLQILSDGIGMLLVDVGGVKLFDLERPDASATLLRIPQNDAELASSCLHPSMPSAFLVGDEAGRITLLDMRQQPEDLTPSVRIFSEKHTTNAHVEGSQAVGSLVFSPTGDTFVSRTFGDVHQWDLRQPDRPVAMTNIQWFPGKMARVVDEHFIRDQFRTAIMADHRVVTGGYSADFFIWSPGADVKRTHKAVSARTPTPPREPGSDFTKRVTCCEAHPTENVVAVVSTAMLFVYSARGK